MAARTADDPLILRVFERGTGELQWEKNFFYIFEVLATSIDARGWVVAPGTNTANPLAHSGVVVL